MNMRQWASNDKALMKMIREEDRCSDKKMKVLGMIWELEKDE